MACLLPNSPRSLPWKDADNAYHRSWSPRHLPHALRSSDAPGHRSSNKPRLSRSVFSHTPGKCLLSGARSVHMGQHRRLYPGPHHVPDQSLPVSGKWSQLRPLQNAPGLYLQYEEGNLHPHALRSGMRIMQFLSCLRAFFLSGLVRIWFLSLS